MASAPGKVMLLGDHAVVHGHPCLVAAIDQRFQLRAEPLHEPILRVSAPLLALEDYEKPLSQLTTNEVPKAAEYIEYAAAAFLEHYPIAGGVQINTSAENLDSRFGLGTSAAATVTTVKALAETSGVAVHQRAIFEIAYQALCNLKGVGSGFDMAAATYGGCLYFRAGGQMIEPLHIKPFQLIVAYSGYKADTPTLIREMQARADKDPQAVQSLFAASERIVEAGRVAIEAGDFKRLGNLFSEHQEVLQKLGASTPELDEICRVSLGAGADGAKLSGAGGGDCAIVLAKPERSENVRTALEHAGFATMTVTAGAQGVR